MSTEQCLRCDDSSMSGAPKSTKPGVRDEWQPLDQGLQGEKRISILRLNSALNRI